jgi:DNA-binding transcriptional LysR family regulator
MKFENLDEPRLLLQAAAHGSLTAAAKALKVTPAAASATLKKLEARLGVRLFERSTRSLRITVEGEALLGFCERALALLDEGTAAVAAGSRDLSGTLRVTAPSDLTRRVLVPMLDAFLDAHPHIKLDLMPCDVVYDLMRHPIDVAIRYGEPTQDGLVAQRLATVPRVLVASPAYLARHGTPRHPDELAHHECLTYQLGDRLYDEWRFHGPQGNSVQVKVAGRRSTGDGSLTQQWALDGRGIAYKSALDLHDALVRGELVRLLPEWRGEPVLVHAMLPSNRFIAARVKALLAHLRQCFQAAQSASETITPSLATSPEGTSP